jgi:hypothetical protein
MRGGGGCVGSQPMFTAVHNLGYSDYDVFFKEKKIIEIHRYIGVKSNSKTLL